ncbi:MAG: DUF4326 domain-containing protein [Gammaproteobacteria bacterium]
MSIRQIPTILIAYPRSFSCYEKFERKVSTILSNLSGYHLAYLADYNELICKYFSSDSRVRDSLAHLDEEHMEGVTHAIIFNDDESHTNLIEHAKKIGIKARVIEAGVTKAVNIDKGNKHDVYIGRGSPWGNPYGIGFDGDRGEVIRKFKYDFERGFLKFNKEDVLKLKGKTLGCHCKPAACHGDVIAEYLNSVDDGK